MPIVKATESLGRRPVIIVLYGDPGVCKTSLFHTCEEPLLLDFDRGVQRSFGRKDALILDKWDEVLQEETAGTFKNYKTIGIDTAKAALDDFLMVHVTKKDYKLAHNKLQAYGAIGDAFKLFTNNRRADGADLVIIAHSKKESENNRNIPDVTGQSYQLLMRIADQVGFVRMENNKRVISFNPTDTSVGKNVAELPTMLIPDKADPAFRTFGAELIESVKAAISNNDEAQRETLAKIEQYAIRLTEVQNADDLNEFTDFIKGEPDHIKVPFRNSVPARATELGLFLNASKQYEAKPTGEALKAEAVEVTPAELPAPVTPPAETPAPKKAPAKAAAKTQSPNAEAVPAKEPTPPADVQPLEWFQQRIDQNVWMQGAKEGDYTGAMLIDGNHYPGYMHGVLQLVGHTFRDLEAGEDPNATYLKKKEVVND